MVAYERGAILEDKVLDFYLAEGPMSGWGRHADLRRRLGGNIPALRDTVQGLMVHIFWAGRYGLDLDQARKGEVQLRSLERKLDRLLELDDSPLPNARPLERRLVGNCRDFSLVMTAFLRAAGVPARARCGFGTYFLPKHFEDHWVCEYWDSDDRRWVLLDAQLDGLMTKTLRLDFDPLNVPRDRFICGGRAWQMCRRGEADPEAFGIFDMHGLWFVRGDLIRDFLALNKLELLPWDHEHGHLAAGAQEGEAGERDLALMDRVAELTLGGDERFDALRALYASDPGFHVPRAWTG
jgi:hypothetical protein